MHPECTLEPVPKSATSSTYIYAIEEQIPPQQQSAENQIPWTAILPTDDDPSTPPQKQLSKWLRWPALLTYALCIAILSGTIGGFLGENITERRNGRISSTVESHCPFTTPTIPSPTPTPTVFARTVAVPTTGCTPPTSQRSFKSTTNYLAAQYTTYCATGWLNDELFALSAASASDCVEACVMYNGHKGGQDRSCVGGGFIPEWWNQSRAMEESGGMPYNCFLKSNDSGTGRNEKAVEVVSLCLAGNCGDVLGGT